MQELVDSALAYRIPRIIFYQFDASVGEARVKENTPRNPVVTGFSGRT